MDIRDTIKTAVETIDTADPADLGSHIAQKLEHQNGVIVDGDFMAEAIEQIRGNDTLTTDELADALAKVVEVDLDDKGDVPTES